MVSTSTTMYVTGSPELDKALGGIPPRTMILIVGHPGAGKTALSSQICYANAMRGKRCLYITFYEDKEKLFENMGKLGINLRDAESRGLLEFVRLPVASVDEILESISSYISRKGCEIVVVDSINPIIEMIGGDANRRAVLLNLFYQIPKIINGILIAVAEIPLGKEALELGAVEFITDYVIFLKHKIEERGILTRLMELRKLRGHPLTTVQFPFSIIEGRGLRVFIPPQPERVYPIIEEPLYATLDFTSKLVGKLRRGDVIYASYPPHARAGMLVLPLIDIAVTNNKRALFVSYKYSPCELREIFELSMKRFLGVEDQYVKSILSEYFIFESMNPVSSSLYHLHAEAMNLVEELNVDIVVFHGVEIFSKTVPNPVDYWSALINELMWLKNRGTLVIRYGSRINAEWNRMNESLSDVVIRAGLKRRGSIPRYTFFAWRRGMDPLILEVDDKFLENLKMEAKKLIELYLSRKARAQGSHPTG